MCGRTCLTLDPDSIKCSCTYKKAQGKLQQEDQKRQEQKGKDNDDKQPEWRNEYNCGLKYTPSYNIAPTEVTPVLVSSAHFNDLKDVHSEDDRVLVPMLWSVIPFWHKGDYKKHGLTTNNCRLEHLQQSKLYKRLLDNGQRCVVLCEGFYEWQTTTKAKSSDRSVYYIYMPQITGLKIEQKSTWNENHINLMKFAGLFDRWIDSNGDSIYCYTVITFESNEKFNWLHHRIPAILETEQQVTDWLNFKSVPGDKALKLLQQPINLIWHRVSNKQVNNARNKSDQCNKVFVESVEPKTPKNKIMQSWLAVGQKRKSNELDTEVDGNDIDKKPKIEDIKDE